MRGMPPACRRSRAGQVLVLASLSLLVLALLVLATLHLGSAFHQRMRLQDTADAAAYSMASVQARAFNLHAYANRAQASHYVSAMLWHSVLSFTYFTEAFLTDLYGLLRTLTQCLPGQGGGLAARVCQTAAAANPALAAALNPVGELLDLYRGFLAGYQHALREADPDAWIGGEVIPWHQTLNHRLAGISSDVMSQTLEQLEPTAREVVEKNDPSLDPDALHPVAAAVNACLFDRTHDRAANGSPLRPNRQVGDPIDPTRVSERDKASRAKRVMGAIANATRDACAPGAHGCPAGLVTARTGGAIVPELLEPLAPLLSGVVRKWGQTRLLSYGMVDGHANVLRNWREPPDAPQGALAQGDNLGADDLYVFELPLLGCGEDDLACWGDGGLGRHPDPTLPQHGMRKVSVWAVNDRETAVPAGGVHWRVKYPDFPAANPELAPSPGPEAPVGINAVTRRIGGVVPFKVYVANVRPIADGNHRWGGIAPFPHFEPGEYAQSCPSEAEASAELAADRAREFNQPSSWAVLAKSPAHLRADVTGGTRRALLNDAAAVRWQEQLLRLEPSQLHRSPLLRPGLNAVARAQTYYHRPGNWAEHPNFFNPFWRARLAPVHPAHGDLPGLSALIETFDVPPHQLVTH